MPSHYHARGGITPAEFIHSNNMPFIEGSIVKYIYRWPFKGKTADEKQSDLNKAAIYTIALAIYHKAESELNKHEINGKVSIEECLLEATDLIDHCMNITCKLEDQT